MIINYVTHLWLRVVAATGPSSRGLAGLNCFLRPWNNLFNTDITDQEHCHCCCCCSCTGHLHFLFFLTVTLFSSSRLALTLIIGNWT